MKILDVPRSGSYQGVTSSRNRFGQYVRTRATPVNPNSAAQASARSRLSQNSIAWRALTDAQRAGWESLGSQMNRTDSLGQGYTLNGFAAYCSVNNYKLAAGDAVVADRGGGGQHLRPLRLRRGAAHRLQVRQAVLRVHEGVDVVGLRQVLPQLGRLRPVGGHNQ